MPQPTIWRSQNPPARSRFHSREYADRLLAQLSIVQRVGRASRRFPWEIRGRILPRLAWVTFGEKWMLAIPAPESIRAKLFSAAADSSDMPSSSSWSPDTDNNTPASLSEPRALWSSLQAVSYCFFVLGCPKSYIRANLSRMLRLRTKARAAVARVLAFIATVWGCGPASACKYGA